MHVSAHTPRMCCCAVRCGPVTLNSYFRARETRLVILVMPTETSRGEDRVWLGTRFGWRSLHSVAATLLHTTAHTHRKRLPFYSNYWPLCSHIRVSRSLASSECAPFATQNWLVRSDCANHADNFHIMYEMLRALLALFERALATFVGLSACGFPFVCAVGSCLAALIEHRNTLCWVWGLCV